MKLRYIILFLTLLAPLGTRAQAWSGILNPTSGAGACTVAPSLAAAACAIDWTQAGIPGGIPDASWTQSGTTIASTGSDQSAQIQTALNACTGSSGSSGKYVLLASGTFTIASSITIPSNCELLGGGANLTHLVASGSGTRLTCEPNAGDGDTEAICMGNSGITYSPVTVSSGATAGSTSLTLASVSGMSIGGYLVITDTNDSWVTVLGGEGTCNWCDGGFTANGTRARGQILEIQNIVGSVVTVAPALYTAYANTPTVTYFAAAAKYAGAAGFSITGTGTQSGGWGALIGMNLCAYCFVHGVEFQYADNNWLNLAWGYRDQVQGNYFTNTLDHTSGSFDGTVDIFFKTSGALITNNIMERGHVGGAMFEWGAAGNVFSYNYILSGFDVNATDWIVPSINMHGAHPQFNLIEGNVMPIYYPDEIWGSSSHNTNFRNWIQGTAFICKPVTGASGSVVCSPSGIYGNSGVNSWLGFTYSFAENISHWSWYDNFVGEVVGSANQQGLPGFSGTPESNVALLNWTSAACSSGCRDVGGPGHVAYNMTFGFGETNDDGSGTGCSGGVSPCHSVDAWDTSFLYKQYTFTSTTSNCLSGGTSSTCSTALPNSFYLSAKPSWWMNAVNYPAVGPDITGGTGPGGHTSLTASNPAQYCYLTTMSGVDGGAGSPLTFNENTCYGGTASPIATFTPTSPINFGQVQVGTNKLIGVTLQNTGTANLVVSTVSLGSVIFSLINNTCGSPSTITNGIPGTGFTLTPGQSCTFNANYTPATIGSNDLVSVFFSPGANNPDQLQLSGQAIARIAPTGPALTIFSGITVTNGVSNEAH